MALVPLKKNLTPGTTKSEFLKETKKNEKRDFEKNIRTKTIIFYAQDLVYKNATVLMFQISLKTRTKFRWILISNSDFVYRSTFFSSIRRKIRGKLKKNAQSPLVFSFNILSSKRQIFPVLIDIPRDHPSSRGKILVPLCSVYQRKPYSIKWFLNHFFIRYTSILLCKETTIFKKYF